MKIATFNVNGIKSRLPNLLAWLARERPDIVCLQELKAVDTAFPTQPLAQAGYTALVSGQRSWNGVAILARNMPIVAVLLALAGDALDESPRTTGGLPTSCRASTNDGVDASPVFADELIRRPQSQSYVGIPSPISVELGSASDGLIEPDRALSIPVYLDR